MRGGFAPGGLYADGSLLIFRKGFTADTIREASRIYAMAADVSTFVITRRASRFLLPFGAVFGIISVLIRAAIGGLHSYATLGFHDGNTIDIRADRLVIDAMYRAWNQRTSM